MELKIFSVRDIKADNTFSTPYFKQTHGDAEREFIKATNDPQSRLYDFPEDFSLWYIGNFNTTTGEFNTVHPQHLLEAVAVKKQSSKKLDHPAMA